MGSTESFQAVVVGGGPAGSTMAWALARQGVNVALIERTEYPREKVCGDFVEPAGLRVLGAMGCLETLERQSQLPITHVAGFVSCEQVYQGEIPYMHDKYNLPPHGYIIPRETLDMEMFNCAAAAGAKVYTGANVTGVVREGHTTTVNVRLKDKSTFSLKAPMVVGADGVTSVVKRSYIGKLPRHEWYTSSSQRAYVEGVDLAEGEATMWFDEACYPGYGWIFPMHGGRANVGIGILKEAAIRHNVNVPDMFTGFIERLKRHHPACENIRIEREPIGGRVDSYAAIDCNVFDGAILVGDAGCFVDPMTYEGITPGMESAIIGSRTVMDALETGHFDPQFLSQFESDYREHFDPSMRFLDFGSAAVKNRHLRDFFLSVIKQGWQQAAEDPDFARTSGTVLGGLDLRPWPVTQQMWQKIGRYFVEGGKTTIREFMRGRSGYDTPFGRDMRKWQSGTRVSMLADLPWHMNWLKDVAVKLARVDFTSHNPRLQGALHYLDSTNLRADQEEASHG